MNVSTTDIGLEAYRRDEDTGSEYSDYFDDNHPKETATASAMKGKLIICVQMSPFSNKLCS